MTQVAARSTVDAKRRAIREISGAPASRSPLRVEAHADGRAVLDDWRALAAEASAPPYQSPDWALPWIEAIGAAAGVRPLIAVARDAAGRAEALLPLGVRRHGVVEVASFLGAKDSNFNMGLFRPGRVWHRAELEELLRAVAAAAPARVDLFALRSQPHAWAGLPNPLAALPHQPSPSFGYKARLAADPELFFKTHLSRDSRKKVRQKMNRLRALGPVALVEADTPGTTARLLDAFGEQRWARNAAAGIGCGELPALRRFLDRAAGPGGPVAVYGLLCGDRVVATLAGLRHRRRFSGMLTSFTAEPEFARTSPGELLLSEVIRRHCLDGFEAFDLGVGEARYKESYCPEVEELFDSFVPTTALGYAVARAAGHRTRLKRAIKQSRWAWPLAQRLRRGRRLLGPRPGPD